MRKPEQLTRNLLILLAVIVPLLVLVLVGRDFILNAVVIPVEYFFFLANIGVRALPQYIFWAIFCAVALIVALMSLVSGENEVQADNRRIQERTASERVAFWAMQVRMSHGGDYSRMRFSDYFSRLILEILEYTGRVDPVDYKERIQDGSLDLPEPVLFFLRTRLASIYQLGPASFKERLAESWLRIEEFFRRKPRQAANDAFEGQIQQAIEYLENELEGEKQAHGH